MLRTTLLNGITNERDKDYTALWLSIITEGVISGLEVTTNKVGLGVCFIKATRTATTPQEEILVKFEATTDEIIDTSGTKKVWIEIEQNNINDPGLNDVNGTTAGSIKTGASYPTSNFIPLADIVAGVITDDRNFIKLKKEILDLLGLDIDITTTWDITANKFFGDGSGLTGILSEAEITESELVAGEDITSLDAIEPSKLTKWLDYSLWGGNTHNVLALKLDTNKTLFIYRDEADSNKGKARVWTNVGSVITYGSEVTFEANGVSYASMWLDLLGTDKVVVTYENAGTNLVNFVILSISWTTVIPGTPTVGATWASGIPGIVKIDTDKFFCCYGYSTVVSGVVWTVSGTTITLWTTVNFTVWGSNMSDTTAIFLETDKVLIVYEDSSTSWSRVVSISWTVPTAGTQVVTLWNTRNFSGVLIDTNKVLITWVYPSSSLRIWIVTISGTTVTEYGYDAIVVTGADVSSVVNYLSDTVLVTYGKALRFVTWSGTSIDAGIENILLTGAWLTGYKIDLVDSDKLVLPFKSSSSTQEASILTLWDWYYKAIWSFIGFSKNTILKGETFKLATGGILWGFVGLEFGKNYYLWSIPWTISTSGTILVWRAISTTQILINPGSFST